MASILSYHEKPTPRSIYDVAVLGKALDLLEALSDGEELGLTELSDQTEVSKASAFRILSTLESRGWVTKNPANRKYRPGPKLITLSSRIVAGLDLVRCARPILEAIQAEFGETVNLGVLSDDQVLYLDMLESRHGLRTAAGIGKRDHLHSTSLGKAMLAQLSTDEVRQLVARRGLVRLTPRTITTIEALERDLVGVRTRGYAVDDEENEVGARCVGVAIRNAFGRPVAAVSVSGPAWRLSDEVIQRIGPRLANAAREIEQAMGFASQRAAPQNRRRPRRASPGRSRP